MENFESTPVSNVIPIKITAPNSLRSRSRKQKPRFDGPISEPMWKRIEKLNSAYSDSFNYAIYDRLYHRFKSKLPRGGVVFQTPFKLVNNHSSCSKCHYAFEVDTYGRGCVHDCVFCYAKDQLEHYGYWNRPIPFPVDIVSIRETFATVFETDRPSKWRSLLEQRIPLRIGSMSDSFMWMDTKYHVTYELLKILRFYKYPYVIFTRSDLVGRDDYVDVLDPKLASVQFSIAGENEDLTRLMEPGAPSVARRLRAVKNLTDAGIWTAVRLNPLFPMFPDGYFTRPDTVRKKFGSLEAAPNFPLFTFNFIDQLKAAGTQSVIAGFVRLSRISLKRVSRVTGIDLTPFFAEENTRGLAANQFSDSEIAFYYKKIQWLCAQRNIRFSTCYIGNGLKDYYQYQELWADKRDCCDIRASVDGFKASAQQISWEERARHARTKEMVLEAKTNELLFAKNSEHAPKDEQHDHD